MADLELRNLWLLDAADQAPNDVPGQIAWLNTQRTTYSTLVKSGDWAVNIQSRAGRHTTMNRGITDKQHHDAIVAALRYLGATDLGGGKILTPVFSGLQR